MTDELSATFAALADPTRRAILSRLLAGECSVTDLAEPFDMTMPAVSKHLRVLERAGLIARRREAQWRHCRIEAGPLKEVADWTERYRHIWEERLDRLDRYLQQTKAQRAPSRAAIQQRNTPLGRRGRDPFCAGSSEEKEKKRHDRKQRKK